MGADEPVEDGEKVREDAPGSGLRSDHEAQPPGVEAPAEPDTQPAEDVPDPDAARERGDE